MKTTLITKLFIIIIFILITNLSARLSLENNDLKQENDNNVLKVIKVSNRILETKEPTISIESIDDNTINKNSNTKNKVKYL